MLPHILSTVPQMLQNGRLITLCDTLTTNKYRGGKERFEIVRKLYNDLYLIIMSFV